MVRLILTVVCMQETDSPAVDCEVNVDELLKDAVSEVPEVVPSRSRRVSFEDFPSRARSSSLTRRESARESGEAGPMSMQSPLRSRALVSADVGLMRLRGFDSVSAQLQKS